MADMAMAGITDTITTTAPVSARPMTMAIDAATDGH